MNIDYQTEELKYIGGVYNIKLNSKLLYTNFFIFPTANMDSTDNQTIYKIIYNKHLTDYMNNKYEEFHKFIQDFSNLQFELVDLISSDEHHIIENKLKTIMNKSQNVFDMSSMLDALETDIMMEDLFGKYH